MVTSNDHNGRHCPDLEETQTCNMGNCPVNCPVSAWAEWTDCTASCDEGFQERTRSATNHPDLTVGDGSTEHPGHGNQDCPELGEYRSFNSHPCPVDCEYGDWSTSTACSATCGTGFSTKDRLVTKHPQHGGKPCPSLHDSSPCNSAVCATDCVVTEWSIYSVCTRSCASEYQDDGSKILGHQSRNRVINTVAKDGGKPCPSLHEEQHCNTQLCPVDCYMSQYGAYSACSKTCGTGEKIKRRTVEQHPARGGKECGSESSAAECTNPLNADLCPIDCQLSPWSDYTDCSANCDGGEQTATRSVVTAATLNGAACNATLSDTRQCNMMSCSTEGCQVGDWTKWSDCSTACGGGQQVKTRPITRMPSADGAGCPSLSEVQPCNTHGCGCSHVRCSYSKHRSGRWRIRVMHSRLESLGKRHKCAFNYVSNRCECKCWYAEHYLADMPNAPALNFDRDNFTWKNLVFHEAATGNSEALTGEGQHSSGWKLRHQGQSYEDIGYTNGFKGGSGNTDKDWSGSGTTKHSASNPHYGHQNYWNNRNSNGH